MINLKFWKKKEGANNVPANKHELAESKKTLGMFEVERELGRGAMGVIYLGRDPAGGRNVAIKTMTLANELNADLLQDAKSRFLREARILVWLDHPDIVTIYDVGEENGLAYIAMEFVGGVELTEFTNPRKMLTLQKTLEIMARAADALGYAHEQNIIHRDVKPGNIMYDAASNTVKVMDFGISRLTNLSMSQPGVIVGSAPYMSPEQVLCKQIDGRSDLFSLGATFYELVSGRLPFEGDSKFDIISRIVKEPHTDILAIKPDLPHCVCAIINRALTKDMEGRFQSGYQMAEAIRQCAETL